VMESYIFLDYVQEYASFPFLENLCDNDHLNVFYIYHLKQIS
jgi:hypothetical protein